MTRKVVLNGGSSHGRLMTVMHGSRLTVTSVMPPETYARPEHPFIVAGLEVWDVVLAVGPSSVGHMIDSIKA